MAEEALITAPDEIRTARLLLRKPQATDAPLMFTAYAQDPAVTRYLAWLPHASLTETRAVIDRFLIAWDHGGGAGGKSVAVAAKKTGGEIERGLVAC